MVLFATDWWEAYEAAGIALSPLIVRRALQRRSAPVEPSCRGNPALCLTGQCSAGLETVACSETGRWLYRESGREWRRCEHRAIDTAMERRRARAG